MSVPLLQKYRIQLIFFAIAFILYGNTLRNGYALDDEFVSGPKSIAMKGIKALPKIFTTFHVQDENDNNYEYRPLVKVSYAIEYQLFGEHVMLSHFINILLYGFCLVLLYKLLLLIFRDIPPFVCLLITIVFSFLPIHAEVVASLKNRDVLLSFIFSLSGFIQFLKYQDRSRIINLAFSLLFFVLAFLSKYDVLPYVAIVALVVYQKKKNTKSLWAIVVIFLASITVLVLMKKNLLERADMKRIYKYLENPMFFDRSYLLKSSAALNSLGFYIKMLFFPSGMACYYGFNVIPIWSFDSFYAILGIVALLLMGYVFFARFKKPDLLWYGVLFFAASISMYLNFVKVAPGIVADRFAFFASVGFSIVLIYGLFMKEKKFPSELKDIKPLQKNASIAVLLIFSIVIINRNSEWKDKLTLFETDSDSYPRSVKLSLLSSSQVIIHLADKSGRIRQDQAVQKLKKAETNLITAINTDSSCAGCYNNLSYLLLSYENDPKLALQYLFKGYKVDSTKKELVCNIGISYYRLNQFDSAKYYLFKAIEMDDKKSFMIPYDVLLSVYSKSDVKEGISFFQKAVDSQPASEALNTFLAKLYFENKDTANTFIYYEKALQINPDNPQISEFLQRIKKIYFTGKR